MKNKTQGFQNVVVIIPAYRESDNLRVLLPRLFETLPRAQAIIVDDSDANESIKTKSVVEKTNGKSEILSRDGKRGRGSAVIDGLKHALKNRDAKFFIEMDADLAHSPEECRLLLMAGASSDMVIGSRYLRNSVITNWPMHRLVQSRIINFLLQYVLGLRLTDFTNGFRLYNRSVAEFLVRTPMREKGFIALSEIAYKVQKKGFHISEIPVSFTDRKYGKSNANFRELMMSLVGVFRIRFS